MTSRYFNNHYNYRRCVLLNLLVSKPKYIINNQLIPARHGFTLCVVFAGEDMLK